MTDPKRTTTFFAVVWALSFIVFIIVGVLKIFGSSNNVLTPLFYPSLFTFILSAGISTHLGQKESFNFKKKN